jgi:hypothetical protein
MTASPQQIPLGTTCNGPTYSGTPNAGPVTFYNQDPTNTIDIGTNSTITVNGDNAIPLPPGASVTLPGTVTRYAVAPPGTAPLSVIPDGASFSSSTNITTTGSVTVTGGTVAVSGVGGTVAVAGTVAIAGTPTVDVATVSGNVNIGTVAGSVDVVGQGGFINPGQIANAFRNGTTINVTAGSSNVISGTISVANFASIIFTQNSIVNSSVAAGAAVCALWEFLWLDVNGSVIGTDAVSCLIGSTATWEIPCRGASFQLSLNNVGTVGTLTINVGQVLVDGSYRVIPNIRVVGSALNLVPTITGSTVVVQGAPVNNPSFANINQWIASIVFNYAAANASVVFPFPQWAGQVTGYYQVNTTALVKNAIIVDLSYALQNNVVAGAAYPYGIIYSIPGAIDANPVPFTLNLPPTQCALILDVAAAGGSFDLSLIGVGN